MKFEDLDQYWKRIYTLEWQSVCHKSKAIAALIVSDKGEIISEGRNGVGENSIPNPAVSHAEAEAIRNLDIHKYPLVKQYTLYAALEPCPMCMGTMVMGGIRNVVIAAHDDHGGAIGLMEHSPYIRAKKIKVSWMPKEYADVQRGLQAVREYLYNMNMAKRTRMLQDFSVYNKEGVNAATHLIEEGCFREKNPEDYSIAEIFDKLTAYMKRESVDR